MAAHQENARAQGAHVVLIDESGAFLSPLVRRTLAPRGRTPILKVPGRKRQKVSLIAGLWIAPRRHRIGLYFQGYGDRQLTQHEAAAFLRDLLRHLRGPVHVVWDRGNTHNGEAIRKVLKDYLRLTLHWLPPHAPELNPVEYLWSHIKYGRTANDTPKGHRRTGGTSRQGLATNPGRSRTAGPRLPSSTLESRQPEMNYLTVKNKDQIEQLLNAARQGPPLRRMSGPDRAMLYAVAAYTGLRASELASLTTASFDLDSDTPTVTVAAAYSKHRRQEVLPLHQSLVSELRPWLKSKPTSARVWPGNWAKGKEAGTMLKCHLEAAGIPYVDENGRYADFHALRHTFITNMVKSGVAPKTAQSLARHSTIDLTMNVYTMLTVIDQASALASLPPVPSMGGEGPDNQQPRATGSDGQTATKNGPQKGANRCQSWCHSARLERV